MFYPYFDSTMLIILPGLLLAMWAQFRVSSTFNRYAEISSRAGLTGASAARAILDRAGLTDVAIERVSGKLTDNYDPSSRILHLSDSVYGSTSIASIGVAAHECGHAMQHQEDYTFLRMRSMIVPVVNIGSNLSWPIFLFGLLFSWKPLLFAGIILFSLTVLFTLVTLPVEFNASNRAVRVLSESGYLQGEELAGAQKVLSAAALTYVASALNAILQLLRLLVLAGRRNSD